MAQSVDEYQRTEARDGMRVDWQVPVPVRDGTVLRADVYRPATDGRYPVLLSHGPYAKGQSFQQAYPVQWERMAMRHPDVTAGSTNAYQCWELTDPEKWVPHDYAVVRVDSRGAGWSPGVLDLWSPQETEDFFDCIEWTADQPWSDGNIGLLGISYYAVNQWLVAGLRPPHLKAMIPWEGMSDHYRELCYHGGIRSRFLDTWYPRQLWMQHGYGEARTNPNTGESVAGPHELSEVELANNRVDTVEEVRKHPFDDDWHRARSADFTRITVPFLSAANWGGQGLHLRGNIAAFTNAASEQKWLEIHGLEHWTHFYTDYGLDLQRRFFDHFLKGEDNGWDRRPRVQLQVRHVDRFVPRAEHEWPLDRTDWTRLYLDPERLTLRRDEVAEGWAQYAATGSGLTFYSAPMRAATEITGPVAAKLFISSSTSDADLFLVVRVFDPDGDEVVFQGVLDPHTPVAQGWLRASHRAIDAERSLPYQPFHPHDRAEPLTPGQAYELDVEIWPTSIVVPTGYRIALTVRGRDYEYGGAIDEFGERFHYASRGCGPFVHTDPDDRPAEIFDNTVTVHAGSYLLVPVIPLTTT